VPKGNFVLALKGEKAQECCQGRAAWMLFFLPYDVGRNLKIATDILIVNF